MDSPTRPRTRARRRTDVRWEATDAELMALVRAGDMGAFAELHSRHAAVARATAVALGGSKVSPDDVVNEAFTKLLEAVERGFGPTEAFRPYLLQCVRSVVFSGGRRAGREELADEVPEAPNALDAFDLADENSVVASAFAALPDRWQAVLWMLEVEGKSTSEVAEQLRIRPNAVAALAYRAREGLKERYLSRHVEVGPAEECRAIAPLLAGHVRASLGAREQMRVDAHLEVCESCRDAREELAGLDRSLSRMLIPLFPGMGFAGGAGLLGGPARFVARRWKQVAVGAGATTAAAGLTVIAVTALTNEAQRRPADRTELAGPVETTSTTGRAGQSFSGQSQVSVTTLGGSSSTPSSDPQSATEPPTEPPSTAAAGGDVVTVVFPPDGGAPVVTVTPSTRPRPRPTTTAPPEVLPDVVEPTTTTGPASSTVTTRPTTTTRPSTPSTVVVLPPVPTDPPPTTQPPELFEVKVGEQRGDGQIRHIRLDVLGARGQVVVTFDDGLRTVQRARFVAEVIAQLLDVGGRGWQCAGTTCTGEASDIGTLTLTYLIPDGEEVSVAFTITDGSGRTVRHSAVAFGDPTTTTSSTTTTTTIDDTTSSTVEETTSSTIHEEPPPDTEPPGVSAARRS